MRNCLLPLCLAVIITSCRTGPEGQTNGTGVYYWKTSLDFDRNDQRLADSLGITRFYLRYFDVDWSPTLGMAVPVGELQTGWDQPMAGIEDFQTIPVVYIANRVFTHDQDVDELAGKISDKLKRMNDNVSYSVYASAWQERRPDLAELPAEQLSQEVDSLQDRFLRQVREIQIDCDWTPESREAYFRFLNAMKEKNPGLEISFTLRLHQFRDPDGAGVPPLKKAVLMCYNVAPVHEKETVNAIFDPALIEGYLKRGDYPLEMDAALPLFTWGALFHEDRFKGLASGLSPEDVTDNPLFEKAGENRYRFLKDTVFYDQFMREGDIVRMDGPTVEGLKSVTDRLAGISKVHSLLFFEWNPVKIRTYHAKEIKDAFQARR